MINLETLKAKRKESENTAQGQNIINRLDQIAPMSEGYQFNNQSHFVNFVRYMYIASDNQALKHEGPIEVAKQKELAKPIYAMAKKWKKMRSWEVEFFPETDEDNKLLSILDIQIQWALKHWNDYQTDCELIGWYVHDTQIQRPYHIHAIYIGDEFIKDLFTIMAQTPKEELLKESEEN